MGIADAPPRVDAPVDHRPRLTLRMAARIQTFPDDWKFFGGKTASYRQIGNAFPSCVAEAVGKSLAAVLKKSAGSRVVRIGKSQEV
jgi:DNA (cytosine-5)-methyltransferase 1